MTDPFKNLSPGLRAIEEMARRDRQLEALMQPTAVERFLKQQGVIERMMQPSAVEKMIAQQTRIAQMLDDPVQRAIERHITSPAHIAKIEASFAAAALVPDHWRLAELTREQDYLSAAARASQGLQLLERQEAFMAKFANPIGDIDRLSESAARAVEAWHGRASTDWASDLAGRMSRTTADWAFVEAPEASAEAFARLGRLADVALYSDPYTDEAAEALFIDLGVPTESGNEPEDIEQREARYDEAGRERELIAFPPATYSEIVISAGGPSIFPPPPALVVVGGLIEAVGYSPETAFLLASLEAHLRLHVTARLEAEAGRSWLKQRVPENLREKWRELAEEARAANKPVFAPIHYANFMDLVDVMCRRDNWPLFNTTFRDQGNLRVSMTRLYSVRNDLAHARPICQTDALIARMESTMLFRAMGFSIN